MLGLDHLKMDVRHVTEAGARTCRAPAALANQCARFDVLPILSIELADVAVQERNRIALVVLEAIRDHYGCPTLRATRNRPVRNPVCGPRGHGMQRRPTVEHD